jgi:hypothetical protein
VKKKLVQEKLTNKYGEEEEKIDIKKFKNLALAILFC